MCLNTIKKIKKLKCFIIIIVLAFLTNKLAKNYLYPSIISLIEFEKCPACFGATICDNIYNGTIEIKPFNFHSTMSHLFSSKNVYFGGMNNQQIVIKKLANNKELERFDNKFCQTFNDICLNNNLENSNDKKKHSIDNDEILKLIKRAIHSDFINEDESGLILCPTVKNLANLFNRLTTQQLNYINLLTIILINPEPLVLQILSAENGWPVPRYFGACGRIVIEEYVGLPLTAHYNDPWIIRAKISASLLEIAQLFTFKDINFSFYLTDLSPDNIAVDNNYNVKIIDLENIIIVDRNTIEADQPDNWQEIHQSLDDTDCNDCFIFSPVDICSHRISDHNYFAVCQHILSSQTSTSSIPNGFLHDIPDEVSGQFPDLNTVLNDCTVSGSVNTRIQAGDNLRYLLQNIVDKFL